jgi:hypothetical protein
MQKTCRTPNKAVLFLNAFPLCSNEPVNIIAGLNVLLGYIKTWFSMNQQKSRCFSRDDISKLYI